MENKGKRTKRRQMAVRTENRVWNGFGKMIIN